jgi:hypothetical protein
VLLAAGLGDEQAAVARRSVEEAAFVGVLGGMLGADRVVRAEPPQLEGRPEVVVEPSGLDPGAPEPAPLARAKPGLGDTFPASLRALFDFGYQPTVNPHQGPARQGTTRPINGRATVCRPVISTKF